eukprot:scaffold192793_cov40-Cyclotella_meneghiniana.AAC.4
MKSKVPQVWPQSTYRDTEDAYYAEKVNSTRHSKAKRKRFFPDEEPSTPPSCKSYAIPAKRRRHHRRLFKLRRRFF